jgi:hypothetical protein
VFKDGIFLDMEELTLSGGWGMLLSKVEKLVEAQRGERQRGESECR